MDLQHPANKLTANRVAQFHRRFCILFERKQNETFPLTSLSSCLTKDKFFEYGIIETGLSVSFKRNSILPYSPTSPIILRTPKHNDENLS